MSTINVKDEPIKWEELTKYINKPVYDAFCKKWYILYGYKEFTKKVIVVSNHGNIINNSSTAEKDFIDVKLYDHDINNEKESKNNWHSHGNIITREI
mgnify:CR=1 FL=1